MKSPKWLDALDLELAYRNVQSEYRGDWHKDPWKWPEYEFILKKSQDLLLSWFSGDGCRETSLISVPKENWGVRPAVVLDLVDRIGYQALVDKHSAALIGDLSPSVYGWRLIPGKAEPGKYASNTYQWENYRTHMRMAGSWYDAALKTDIVSCFASMQVHIVIDEINSRVGENGLVNRLTSFLSGFDRIGSRTGLAQRALPSSVLANMMLRHFDDVLTGFAEQIPELAIAGKEPPKRLSFLRWMDDMWLFGDDAGLMRRAQLELQEAALRLGLHLNSSKTEVLEGSAVFDEAMEVELSAVEGGLSSKDSKPLEELIESVLENPEKAGRTRVKFMTKRMLDNHVYHKEQELVRAAPRMPHCADSLARYFRVRFSHETLSEWFLDGVSSEWNLLQWPTSHYLGMFSSEEKVSKGLQEYVQEGVADQNTELPLLTIAAQRLAAWDPVAARSVLGSTIGNRVNPHERRVLSLAALGAHLPGSEVRKWLGQHDSNAPTLLMLEDRHFKAPKVDGGYTTGGPAA